MPGSPLVATSDVLGLALLLTGIVVVWYLMGLAAEGEPEESAEERAEEDLGDPEKGPEESPGDPEKPDQSTHDVGDEVTDAGMEGGDGSTPKPEVTEEDREVLDRAKDRSTGDPGELTLEEELEKLDLEDEPVDADDVDAGDGGSSARKTSSSDGDGI